MTRATKLRALAIVLTLALAGTAVAAGKGLSKVAPPDASVGGMTYAEWSAAWWQWALALDADDTHPFWADDDHFDVTLGQSGKVWFLAGVFGTGNERHITIPAGTRLFLPMINVEASNLESEPWYGEDEEAQLEAAMAIGDAMEDVALTVDGVALDHIEDYRVQSPQFEFWIPEYNALFVEGPDEGTAVSDGYWAMIGPLSKGTHTIYLTGTFGAPYNWGSIETTYHVTVE